MRFLSMVGGIAVVTAITTGVWWWVNNLTIRKLEKEEEELEKELTQMYKKLEEAMNNQKEIE